MSNPVDEEVRDGTNEYSLYFLIAGICVGFATFLQVSQQMSLLRKVSWFLNHTYQNFSLLPQFMLYRIKFNSESISVYYCIIVFNFMVVL